MAQRVEPPSRAADGSNGDPIKGAARASSRGPRSRKEGRVGWPLAPLVSLVAVLVGVAIALVIGVLGLFQLTTAGEDRASRRAEVLSTVLGERVAKLSAEDRETAIRTASTRTGAEYMLLGERGQPVVDATLGLSDELTQALAARAEGPGVEGPGDATTKLGRTRFFVHVLGAAPGATGARGPAIVAFVPVPRPPEAAPGLLSALVALTVLLVGTASLVAWAVARDAERDVAYLTGRVAGMAAVRTEPAGERVPVRTMDEVGALTRAFNDLVGRFASAEQGYRRGLARAVGADKERADFLATVSHELRSPLNAILGFADVLLDEVDGPLPPAAREEVEQIRASGAHLSDLVRDILEFSAIDSGRIQIRAERVQLARVASELVREAQAELRGRPVEVRLDADDAAYAWADPKRVRQIVGNLLGNAVKFTQRGSIEVKVEARGREVAVAVKDTGPGIGPAERQAIFEEYKQGEAARRRGTGLGLAIARRLALLQAGRVELVSELGRGSTFTVLLPAPRDSILPLDPGALGGTS